MSQAIGKYLISVAAAAMLLSLVQSILPKGPVRRVAGFVGGLLVVLAVLSPVVSVDHDTLAQSIGQLQVETQAIEAGAIRANRELLSDIIKQRCETYIWDKANELGADLEVSVTLSQDDEYPYPVSVVLTGSVTPEQRLRLTENISRDMGISSRQQEWKTR